MNIRQKRLHSFGGIEFDIYDIAFVFLLAISTIARIYIFDHPLAAGGGEGSRDYLIAQHIIKYREFPLTGPSTIIHRLLSSPLYYYFISLFLIIKDSFMFLVATFILFQIFTIFLIYKIAKKINPLSALIAVAIFSFSIEILSQSNRIWPYYAMQLFVNTGFFLLLLSYLKRNYILLLLSIFCIVFASTINHTAFAVLPLFLATTFYILRQQNKRFRHYLGIVFAVIGPLFLFFLPPFTFIIKKGLFDGVVSLLWGQGVRGFIFVQSIPDFFRNIFATLSALIANFPFAEHGMFSPVINSALTAALIFSGTVYFFKKRTPQKKYVIVMLLFIIQQIVFISLLSEARTHLYLIPVLGLFAILASEIINSAFSKNVFLTSAKIILVIVLVGTLYTNFYLFSNESTPAENLSIVSSASNALAEEIKTIREEKYFSDINFFQIRSFRTGNLAAANEILWVPLEKKFNRKFTEISGKGSKYKETNSKDYIFLACYDRGEHYDRETCKSHFLKLYKNYEIVKEVFSSRALSIYESKK